KLFRKIFFWCHLTVGMIGGLVILVMSATGVLLTYERQIIAWADTRAYQVTGTAQLPVETLLAKVRESQAGANITMVTVRADTSKPASVALVAAQGAAPGSARTLFVNPYTGDVLGEGAKGVREFFHVVTDWHRWLGAEGASRATTRAITGACNLGFLFIVASGIYLWFPRKRAWQQFKQILWFRRRLPGKARDFNWHNVIGFWSFIPLFIVVLSAAVISYTWASNLAYRVVGETPPAPAQRGPGSPPQANVGQQRGGGERSNTPVPPASLDGLDGLWARAEQQTTGWKSLSLRLPANAEAPAVFTIDSGTGGQPQKRATLTLDRKAGEIVRWEPFASFTKGRQLRSILRFAHTGEVGGIVGQTIAGLVSLGGCFLFYTGLALSWRRFRAWRARRSSVAVPATPAGLEQA
ncbi:MAG: PepSY domain-containing protein, partial [Acidobacteriota bacterium]|nr:PepSY domain-containing protein [Acidobacteriota bacterium]